VSRSGARFSTYSKPAPVLGTATCIVGEVREAREENRRLGIPNVQVDEEGRLTEELPDRTVRLIQPK
jgi:hypothetical protein